MNDLTFIVNDTIFCIRDMNYKHLEDCKNCSDFDEWVYGLTGDGRNDIIGISCLKSYTHSHICKECKSKDYMLVFSDYKKHIHRCENCGNEEFYKVYEIDIGQKEVISEPLECPDCKFVLNEAYRKGKTIRCKCGSKFKAGEIFSFKENELIDSYFNNSWKCIKQFLNINNINVEDIVSVTQYTKDSSNAKVIYFQKHNSNFVSKMQEEDFSRCFTMIKKEVKEDEKTEL